MNKQRGFTLVEIIVSVGIFTVVMLAGIGAIISVNSVSRRTQKIKITMDNLNFALEGMTRELRLGKTYDCTNADTVTAPVAQNCGTSPGGTSIGFIDNEGQVIKYRYNSTLKRIQKFDPTRLSPTSFVDLTAPDVQIDSLLFFIKGAEVPGDDIQPQILISVSGKAGTTTPNALSDFRLQTIVTQRIVDSN